MPIYYPPTDANSSYSPNFAGQAGQQLYESMRNIVSTHQKKQETDAQNRLKLLLEGANLSLEQQRALVTGIQNDPLLKQQFGSVLPKIGTFTENEPVNTQQVQAQTEATKASTERTKVSTQAEQAEMERLDPKKRVAMIQQIAKDLNIDTTKMSPDDLLEFAFNQRITSGSSTKSTQKPLTWKEAYDNLLKGGDINTYAPTTEINTGGQNTVKWADVGPQIMAQVEADRASKAAIHAKGEKPEVKKDLEAIGYSNNSQLMDKLAQGEREYLGQIPGLATRKDIYYDEAGVQHIIDVPVPGNDQQLKEAREFAINRLPNPEGVRAYLGKQKGMGGVVPSTGGDSKDAKKKALLEKIKAARKGK